MEFIGVSEKMAGQVICINDTDWVPVTGFGREEIPGGFYAYLLRTLDDLIIRSEHTRKHCSTGSELWHQILRYTQEMEELRIYIRSQKKKCDLKEINAAVAESKEVFAILSEGKLHEAMEQLKKEGYATLHITL